MLRGQLAIQLLLVPKVITHVISWILEIAKLVTHA